MTDVPQRAFAVWWKDLERWVVPKRLFLLSQLPNGWSLVRVGEIVQQVKDRVKVEHEKEYKMVGIKWYGEGIFHRETVRGEALSSTYVTPVIPNAFIYNRLFAWKGSFAVVPEESRNFFVSNEFPQFIVDKRRILPRYLYLFFMCDSTIKAVNASSIGSAAVSRNRFKEDEFLIFEIPLPPIHTQQAIVGHWEKAQKEISESRQRTYKLDRDIIESVLEDLGIILTPLDKKSKYFVLFWKDIERWGVEFNRWQWNLSDLLLSSKYPMRRLSEIAFVNPTEHAEIDSIGDEDIVSFVPMEAISDKTGKITFPQMRKYREVKNGYTRFINGDVLWAKITPCMQNGKCAVARNLVNGFGFGSTEFHIIRPKDHNNILSEYIWVFLRMERLRKAAQRYFIGSAGQQRVPSLFLTDIYIPFPPIEIQRVIVQQMLERVAEITKERERADRLGVVTKQELEEMILGTRPVP